MQLTVTPNERDFLLGLVDADFEQVDPSRDPQSREQLCMLFAIVDQLGGWDGAEPHYRITLDERLLARLQRHHRESLEDLEHLRRVLANQSAEDPDADDLYDGLSAARSAELTRGYIDTELDELHACGTILARADEAVSA